MERRLEGNPLKAAILACTPGQCAELFALPPTIMVKNSGDVYTVELHEWLLQSHWRKSQLWAKRF